MLPSKSGCWDCKKRAQKFKIESQQWGKVDHGNHLWNSADQAMHNFILKWVSVFLRSLQYAKYLKSVFHFQRFLKPKWNSFYVLLCIVCRNWKQNFQTSARSALLNLYFLGFVPLKCSRSIVFFMLVVSWIPRSLPCQADVRLDLEPWCTIPESDVDVVLIEKKHMV